MTRTTARRSSTIAALLLCLCASSAMAVHARSTPRGSRCTKTTRRSSRNGSRLITVPPKFVGFVATEFLTAARGKLLPSLYRGRASVAARITAQLEERHDHEADISSQRGGGQPCEPSRDR